MTPRRRNKDVAPSFDLSCEEFAAILSAADEQFLAGNYERVESEYLYPLGITAERLQAISDNCGPEFSRKFIDLIGLSMLRCDAPVLKAASILYWELGLIEANRQKDSYWTLTCLRGLVEASLWSEDDNLMNGEVGNYMLLPAYLRIHLTYSCEYDSPSVEEMLAELHHLGTHILERRVSSTSAHEKLLQMAAEHRDKFSLEFDLSDEYNQEYLRLLDLFVGSLANCGFDGDIERLHFKFGPEDAERPLIRTILSRDPLLGKMWLMPPEFDFTEILEGEDVSIRNNLQARLIDRGNVRENTEEEESDGQSF